MRSGHQRVSRLTLRSTSYQQRECLWWGLCCIVDFMFSVTMVNTNVSCVLSFGTAPWCEPQDEHWLSHSVRHLDWWAALDFVAAASCCTKSSSFSRPSLRRLLASALYFFSADFVLDFPLTGDCFDEENTSRVLVATSARLFLVFDAPTASR